MPWWLNHWKLLIKHYFTRCLLCWVEMDDDHLILTRKTTPYRKHWTANAKTVLEAVSLSTMNPLAFHFFFLNAIEPPVSDQPKCHALVVTSGRWSLTRAWTILGQNFYSFKYAWYLQRPNPWANTHPMFHSCGKSNLAKKTRISHRYIFVSCTAQKCDKVSTPPLYHLSSVRLPEVTNQ